ncbi:MAG: DNA polymerase IV [Alphaproteobacteria bacterium]|nr:MAG: DNA polymerase IV [Alphaproteobacteria bacterium]
MPGPDVPALCLDCAADAPAARCPACGSPRIARHPELHRLAIAHLDCDAFYAAVEKRENPALRDRPVIVGGGRRGVVSTACYLARIRGVRSAMPMFRALALCPEAVVIRPRMQLYAGVSRAIRAMMEELTPLVEPLSLDEAFLDLSGTARLHRASPARMLVRLARRIERETGVTVSIGLSHNMFLAKLASELDKPRGFAVIGRAETLDRLAPMPVSAIWGVGPGLAAALERDGLRRIADLRARGETALRARLGARTGTRLWELAHGRDPRRVGRDAPPQAISHEITFETDLADAGLLDGHLWRLAEKLADRAKARGLGGRVVTLKLRRADFRLLTRRVTLDDATQLAGRIHRAASALLSREMAQRPFRLIGVGLSGLVPEGEADRGLDLLHPEEARRAAAERAADRIRARFGAGAIIIGRALR